MKTQSEATINAIINIAQEQGYEAKPFETDYKKVLSKSDITNVVDLITAGMTSGIIQMSESAHAKFDNDPKALRRYTVGLVNDRLRKAKAINGNTKYEAQEPGKLSGSRDPQLKALQQVLELQKGTEHEVEIQEAIDARKAELGTAKAKTVEINVDALPADLRAKLGI